MEIIIIILSIHVSYNFYSSDGNKKYEKTTLWFIEFTIPDYCSGFYMYVLCTW